MVRQAQAMIANGELGEIRLVHVEFSMDWLRARSTRPEMGRQPGVLTPKVRPWWRDCRHRYARMAFSAVRIWPAGRELLANVASFLDVGLTTMLTSCSASKTARGAR